MESVDIDRAGVAHRHFVGDVVGAFTVVDDRNNRLGHTDRWHQDPCRDVVVGRVAVAVWVWVLGVGDPVAVTVVGHAVVVDVDEWAVVGDVGDLLTPG